MVTDADRGLDSFEQITKNKWNESQPVATKAKKEIPDEKILSTDTNIDFLKEILRLTGREERLDRTPILSDKQEKVFDELLPFLRRSKKDNIGTEATWSLFNRILLVLGIKPVEMSFFENILFNVDFDDLNRFKIAVDKFRQLCMLEYGSFRFCYKVLRTGEDSYKQIDVKSLVMLHFPDGETVTKREKDYKKKAKTVGLIKIESGLSFVLGYISGDFASKVNSARNKLKQLLRGALEPGKSIADFKEFMGLLGKEETEKSFDQLVNESTISSEDKLLYPQIYAPEMNYVDIIRNAIKECEAIDDNSIDKAKKEGELNSTVYLGMHDIDVYMATSMREPIHFTSNSSFVTSLFNDSALNGWNLRYFDPTQSYLKDRIQKGLIESLMIKRAKVTIYNAQENDSFGKDSEASVALTQGKDVIVYVARLFTHNKKFMDFYNVIDKSIDYGLEEFLKNLEKSHYLSNMEKADLLGPGKTKGDAIEFAADKISKEILVNVNGNEISAELSHYGYNRENDSDPLQYVPKLIARLEKRAFTFRDIHPLSFQISAKDGVARGVFVVRSVANTAKILRNLLLGNLEYEIKETPYNYILREKLTGCPIRVVARDPTLTAAFWSEFARDGNAS